MTETRISRTKARDFVSPAPVFVLVEPQMGENIGAVARGMLNFGVSGLRLVRPRDGWPNPKAAATASGAAVVIDNARVFDSVEAALADCQFVMATTARRRDLSTPVYEPVAAAGALRGRIDAGQTCAVLFGGERNGLSSDDIARADAIISIPVNPAFASLNLAHSALITAYEWSRAAGLAQPDYLQSEEFPASRQDLDIFYNSLEARLDEAGYFFPAAKAEGMKRNLRAAFSKAGLTDSEVRTLHGVVKALVRSGTDNDD